MPNVAVTGDLAGGAVTGNITGVTINGKTVVGAGSVVAPHGNSPHNAATMTASSTGITIGGIIPCVTGDAATCGHTITGTSTVTIG